MQRFPFHFLLPNSNFILHYPVRLSEHTQVQLLICQIRTPKSTPAWGDLIGSSDRLRNLVLFGPDPSHDDDDEQVQVSFINRAFIDTGQVGLQLWHSLTKRMDCTPWSGVIPYCRVPAFVSSYTHVVPLGPRSVPSRNDDHCPLPIQTSSLPTVRMKLQLKTDVNVLVAI